MKFAYEVSVGDSFVWCESLVTVTAIEKHANGFYFTVDRFGQSLTIHYYADESLQSVRTTP